jgi:TPR repeat protein
MQYELGECYFIGRYMNEDIGDNALALQWYLMAVAQ